MRRALSRLLSFIEAYITHDVFGFSGIGIACYIFSFLSLSTSLSCLYFTQELKGGLVTTNYYEHEYPFYGLYLSLFCFTLFSVFLFLLRLPRCCCCCTESARALLPIVGYILELLATWFACLQKLCVCVCVGHSVGCCYLEAFSPCKEGDINGIATVVDALFSLFLGRGC